MVMNNQIIAVICSAAEFYTVLQFAILVKREGINDTFPIRFGKSIVGTGKFFPACPITVGNAAAYQSILHRNSWQITINTEYPGEFSLLILLYKG